MFNIPNHQELQIKTMGCHLRPIRWISSKRQKISIEEDVVERIHGNLSKDIN
jgi:hypothetical protein